MKSPLHDLHPSTSCLSSLHQPLLLRGGNRSSSSGPSRWLSVFTDSLVNEGSIHSDWVKNFAKKMELQSSASPEKTLFQDVYARSLDGEVIPKHPFLAVALSAPFVWALGDLGFWFVNQLFLITILYSAFNLIRKHFGDRAAALVCGSMLWGSQLLFYQYAFSYDLLGVALLFSGIALGRSRPGIGGFLILMAGAIRLSHLLLAPFLLLFLISYHRKDISRGCLKITSGALMALFCFGLQNQLLLGDFLTTSYHRTPYFFAGEEIMGTTKAIFTVETLFSGWKRKLFDPQLGLLLFNPLLLVVLGSIILNKATRNYVLTTPHLLLFLGASIQIIFFFGLRLWWPSGTGGFFEERAWIPYGIGNRYLMPAILLFYLSLAPLAEQFLVHRRKKES